jgi:hypothetical protein
MSLKAKTDLGAFAKEHYGVFGEQFPGTTRIELQQGKRRVLPAGRPAHMWLPFQLNFSFINSSGTPSLRARPPSPGPYIRHYLLLNLSLTSAA